MSGADELFSRFRDPLEVEAYRERRQARFEQSVVKRLVRAGSPERMMGGWGWAYADAKERFGDDSLTFRWFHDTFSAFPAKLCSAKLKNIHRITLPQLFGSDFMKLPCMHEYARLATQMGWDPRTDWIAMFFNCPRAPGAGTMVLHNQPIQAQNVVNTEQREDMETRIIRPFGKPQIVYVMESFKSFVTVTLGENWQSE